MPGDPVTRSMRTRLRRICQPPCRPMDEAKVDVSMLTDEKVGSIHAILIDGDSSAEEKRRKSA